MPCYCSDIANCKADMNDLTTASASIVALQNIGTDSIAAYLSALRSNVDSAFSPDNKATLLTAIDTFNDDINLLLSSMLERCASESLSLFSKLNTLETQDWRHHEDERIAAEAAAAAPATSRRTGR